MTEYAVPGEPHQRRPSWVEEWSVSFQYLVLPWRCPVCDQVVAETIAQDRKPEVRTIVVGVKSLTRQPEADRDGLPFYGPTRRAMRHKSERSKPETLSNTAWQRAHNSNEYLENLGDQARRGRSSMPAVDHSPIEDHEFDSLCTNCPRRLRFRMPSASGAVLS